MKPGLSWELTDGVLLMCAHLHFYKLHAGRNLTFLDLRKCTHLYTQYRKQNIIPVFYYMRDMPRIVRVQTRVTLLCVQKGLKLCMCTMNSRYLNACNWNSSDCILLSKSFCVYTCTNIMQKYFTIHSENYEYIATFITAAALVQMPGCGWWWSSSPLDHIYC